MSEQGNELRDAIREIFARFAAPLEVRRSEVRADPFGGLARADCEIQRLKATERLGEPRFARAG